ncbi:class I SAM-dependent methyltransferase [Candidatus Gottesmanbacteria bacterium]|nr:class I SAM-dependent methyltransferase [Candidatus Gottesmanbacteria bacterium]
MRDIPFFLKTYLAKRPFFLSLIRAKEAYLFQRFLPLKNPILDIGCGDGFFAKTALIMFENSTENYIDVGLDLENSRIKEAKMVGIYKRVVKYNGSKIPFPSRYFSTIIANCVLEHVMDIEIVLEEIYRVLKPNGLFLTTVMAKQWEKYMFGALLLGSRYQKWMQKKQVHLNLLNADGWDDVFTRLDFSIKEKIGYFPKSICMLFDMAHYLSLPSLVTYKLFGKWVLLGDKLSVIYPINLLSKILKTNTHPDESGAIFYLLEK